MKFTITLVLECESLPDDNDDNKYMAEIVGDTAMDGAKKHLDPKRNAKSKSCAVEYTDKVVVAVR